MYKGASRFGQHLRQKGVKPSSGAHLHGKGHKASIRKGRPKSKYLMTLDAAAQARQERERAQDAASAQWKLVRKDDKS
jgi:hypothetical protein